MKTLLLLVFLGFGAWGLSKVAPRLWAWPDVPANVQHWGPKIEHRQAMQAACNNGYLATCLYECTIGGLFVIALHFFVLCSSGLHLVGLAVVITALVVGWGVLKLLEAWWGLIVSG